jgi:hypothetical protein
LVEQTGQQHVAQLRRAHAQAPVTHVDVLLSIALRRTRRYTRHKPPDGHDGASR